MVQSLEAHLAHQRALQLRHGQLPPDGPPAPLILDSWARSVQAGLDPASAAAVEVVEAAELDRRRVQSYLVRGLAQAQLETLAQQIAGSNFLLAFADAEGVVLDLYADNRFLSAGDPSSIVAGSCWAESLCGTNGLGTALATGSAVAVSGLEHFRLSLGELTCTAAPVRDAAGVIVGVLDASSYFSSRQRHTLALVQMAATHIENELLAHQMRQHLVVAVHPRAEYLNTLSACLLAFDALGRVCALNARAQQMLAGLNPAAGAPFEALFDGRFERVLGLAAPGSVLPLTDRMGSRMVAKVLNRPGRPAAAAMAQPSRVPEEPGARRRSAVSGWQGPASTAAAQAATTSAPDFVADDPAVRACCEQVQAAVRLGVPVLIQGETGTGKELLARHAHQLSGRRGPFVAVNCGALPRELFEAELFGHVGGAFTGARREGGMGLITSADGGTLLLDELRDLPLQLQAALLRFLDDGLVRPVGSTQAHRVDVQVLAATPVDLAADVAARRFRDDLMYRLAVVQVVLPPLRHRCDLSQAASALLAALDARAALSAQAVDCLAQHHWPGNFRELRTVLTRALLKQAPAADGWRVLDADAVVAELRGVTAPSGRAADTAGLAGATQFGAAGRAGGLRQSLSNQVRQAHMRFDGNVSHTAQALGISRTTVYRHLREAGSPPE